MGRGEGGSAKTILSEEGYLVRKTMMRTRERGTFFDRTHAMDPHLPVETPHPSRHILGKSAPGWIFAAEISAMTAYSAKVEQPMKWKISLPSLEIRVVPSGITPLPCVALG